MLRAYHIGSPEIKLTVTESHEPDTVHIALHHSSITLTQAEAKELADLFNYSSYSKNNIEWAPDVDESAVENVCT